MARLEKELKKGDLVYYEKFGGSGLGYVTQIIDDEYCRINHKLTFVDEVIKITKEWYKKECRNNLPFLTWSQADIKKIHEIYKEKPNSWIRDNYRKGAGYTGD